MSHNSENQSEPEAQDKVAGVAFLTGVIAGLFVFALFVDDRITTSWGDWIGQGLAMIVGVVVAAVCLLPIMSSKSSFKKTLGHAVNGILLIASVWGAAAAAAYWGNERLSSAVWLMSLGGFGLLLQKLFAPDRNLGCWVGLYVAFFVVGTLAATAEIMHWD
jgi:hypothetical protein